MCHFVLCGCVTLCVCCVGMVAGGHNGSHVLTWRLWRAKGSRQCSGDQTLATVVTIRVCVVCNFIPQNLIIILFHVMGSLDSAPRLMLAR